MSFRNLFVIASMICVVAACGGSGSGASCSKFTACGGDIIGTWSVEDICVENPMKLFAAAFPTECTASATARGEVSGTFVFNRDHSYTRTLKQNIELDQTLAPTCIHAVLGATVPIDASACTMLQNQLVGPSTDFPAGTCKLEAGGCSCSLQFTEQNLSTSGSYELSETKLLYDDGGTDSFCATATSLEFSQLNSGTTVRLVLKKSG